MTNLKKTAKTLKTLGFSYWEAYDYLLMALTMEYMNKNRSIDFIREFSVRLFLDDLSSVYVDKSEQDRINKIYCND